jgi:hypothetical protein
LEDEDENLKLSDLNDLEYTQENEESLSQAQLDVDQYTQDKAKQSEFKSDLTLDSIKKYLLLNK